MLTLLKEPLSGRPARALAARNSTWDFHLKRCGQGEGTQYRFGDSHDQPRRGGTREEVLLLMAEEGSPPPARGRSSSPWPQIPGRETRRGVLYFFISRWCLPWAKPNQIPEDEGTPGCSEGPERGGGH